MNFDQATNCVREVKTGGRLNIRHHKESGHDDHIDTWMLGVHAAANAEPLAMGNLTVGETRETAGLVEGVRGGREELGGGGRGVSGW